jgi:hypothetical protein
MVRAVYQGAAAADPGRQGPRGECLSGLVVNRGNDARPVREPLPLRLPREMAEHARQHGEAGHHEHDHHDHDHDHDHHGHGHGPSVNGGSRPAPRG